MTQPEDVIRLTPFIVVGILLAMIYWVARWLVGAPKTRDPWDVEVENQMNDPEAAPLCHHCLEPQRHNGWFCPHCGATVGQYANCMPYVYAFSQGEVLRTGVTTHVRRSFFTVIAYVFISCVIFAPLVILTPIYWYFFFRHLKAQRANAEMEGE